MALDDIQALVQSKLEDIEAEIAGRRAQLEVELTPLLAERERLKKMATLASGTPPPGGERHKSDRAARRQRLIDYMLSKGYVSPSKTITSDEAGALLDLDPRATGTLLGAMRRFGYVAGGKQDGYWVPR